MTMLLELSTQPNYEEIRSRFFSFKRKNNSTFGVAGETERRACNGIVVKDEAGSLFGVALFMVYEDRVSVYEFTAVSTDQEEVGRLMAQGLRNVAKQNHIDSILCELYQNAFVEEFLKRSGFELLAFHEGWKDGSSRKEFWRLKVDGDAKVRQFPALDEQRRNARARL